MALLFCLKLCLSRAPVFAGINMATASRYRFGKFRAIAARVVVRWHRASFGQSCAEID